MKNCQGVQIQGVRILLPQMKIVRESKSKLSQNTPIQNENCHRVQIQGVPESKQGVPPKMKIVRESKSEVSQNTPENENSQGVQIQGVPKMKIVKESKSESLNTRPKWKLS